MRIRSALDARRLRPLPLGRQIVLLTAGATALAVLLLTVILQLVLGHLATTDIDRVVHDRTTSVIGSIGNRDGRIEVPRSQLSAGVAVYASGGTLVAGTPPANLSEDYRRLRLTDEPRTISIEDTSRVEARPFRRAGLTGVVIVSEAFAPYEEAERLALIVSIVAGLVTVAAAGMVAMWATRRALRPVVEMARTASDWSEHDLTRRFSGDRPPARSSDELGTLAGTLDGLLDRVASAIRSEQRLTSELAHELRTPLTAIRGEAELALMRDELPVATREALAGVVAATQRMSQTISTLLDLARNDADVLASSRSALGEVVAEVAELAEDAGAAGLERPVDGAGSMDAGAAGPGAERAMTAVAVEVDVDSVRLALPHSLAVRALAPVVENAVRFARSRVVVTSRRDGALVEVVVEDDGPGVAGDLTDRLFEPGATSGTSAGLGLAIARRVARTSGGDVSVDPASRPGANRFVVSLPVV